MSQQKHDQQSVKWKLTRSFVIKKYNQFMGDILVLVLSSEVI